MSTTSAHFSLFACLLPQCQDIWVRDFCVRECVLTVIDLSVNMIIALQNIALFLKSTVPGSQYKKYFRHNPYHVVKIQIYLFIFKLKYVVCVHLTLFTSFELM